MIINAIIACMNLKKHYAVWKKPVIQDLILWLYLYEMFRIGKSLRWKSRLVFARGLEKDKYRMMLLNCGAGEASWKFLGLQGGQIRKLKGNQLWIFTRRTDVKAEAAILWPPSAKTQLTRCEEPTLMLEKINGKRRRGWQRMRQLDSITDAMDMNLSKLWESGMLQPMGLQRVGHDLAAQQQQIRNDL